MRILISEVTAIYPLYALLYYANQPFGKFSHRREVQFSLQRDEKLFGS